MDTTTLASYVPDYTLPIVSGCFAFGATLGLSTFAQKLIGISTATKMVPSVLGMATVCLASLTSQRAAICSQAWLKDPDVFSDPEKRRRLLATSPSSYQDCWEIEDNLKIPLHDLRV
jgi:hypothetical protein